MKFTKKLIPLLLLITLLTSLTGCRQKPQPGDGTETETGSTKTETSSERKEIVFWNLYDNSDSLNGQIQAFESMHPGVKIKYKKFVNIEEYWKTILNELAEGEGPDIFAVNNNWVKQHYKKFQPMPADLMNAEKFRETFFDVAGDDLIIDETIMGIPLSIDTLAVYYNKELFSDSVLNENGPAKTWETFEEQVYALTKKDNSKERFGVSAVAMGRADNIMRANDIFYMLMLQHETKFYDDTKQKAIFANKQDVIEGTGKAYYPGVEALSFYTSFAMPSYRNFTWNDIITGQSPEDKEINPFVRGKVAMIFGYPFLYDQLKDAIQVQIKTGGDHIAMEDIGIAEVPQLFDYNETGQRDAFANYFPLVVSRNTEYSTEAWEFLLYISSADSLQTYHEKTNKPTSRRDMVDAQSVEPFWGVFARQAGYAKSFQLFDMDKFNEYLAEAIQTTVKGKKVTAKEALEKAQKKINCILDKNKANANQDIDCDLL